MNDSDRKNNLIHFVALGCPKNRVDTEVLAGMAFDHSWEVTADPEEADAIVVSTCGFIGSAKEESIDTILEMSRFKTEGRCKTLVAAGCLTQRYSDELLAQLPELDQIIGTTDLGALGEILEGHDAPPINHAAGHYLQKRDTPRLIPPGTVSAYIKIGDGCSRQCAFCAIPAIRGKAESRPIDEIVAEARALVAKGVREINLVSQDTSAYGRDLDDGSNLARLLAALDRVPDIGWIRALYLYPDSIDDELLTTLRDAKNVVPYLDVPIQHASGPMLRRMRRGHPASTLKKLINNARRFVPDIHLRTTVLVGHPGETEADFAELLAFIEWARFDHLGAFRYSDEEGTPAYGTGPQVSKRDSYNRWRKLMATQRRIARAKRRSQKGTIVDVLVEGTDDSSGFVLTGRHKGQAPEIDGITYLISSEADRGEIVRARVVKHDDFDLVAEPVETP